MNRERRSFASIPAALAVTYPSLNALKNRRLTTLYGAVLSAGMFRALINPPLDSAGPALCGVPSHSGDVGLLLLHHVLIDHIEGFLSPFLAQLH